MESIPTTWKGWDFQAIEHCYRRGCFESKKQWFDSYLKREVKNQFNMLSVKNELIETMNDYLKRQTAGENNDSCQL